MNIDPTKLFLSVVASVLLLAGGIGILGTKQASLVVADYSPIFSSSEPLNLAQNSSPEVVALENNENTQKYSQIDPENAKIEAEVMTTSIQTSNPTNNSDWSLELISDHSLEITQ